MTCKHCGRDKVNRPRGLCWTCFHRPGVKELYPSGSIYAYRSTPDTLGQGKLAEPTGALPGTPEKVEVMQERASRHELLFHPRDSKWGECQGVNDPAPVAPPLQRKPLLQRGAGRCERRRAA